MLPVCALFDRSPGAEVSYSYIVLRSRLCPYLRIKVCCSDSSQAFFAFFLSVFSIRWLDICSLAGARVYFSNNRHPLRMRCEPGEEDKEET